MNPAIAMAISSFGSSKVYVEDVFAIRNYAGSATTLINTGMDLTGANKGMIWIKPRGTNSGGAFTSSNHIFDTVRGTGLLRSDSTSADAAFSGAFAGFANNGFNLGAVGSALNASGEQYTSRTFKASAKFFDVLSWTGDAASSKSLSHSLGTNIGSAIVKNRSTGNWSVWVRNSSGNYVTLTGGGRGLNSSLAALSTNETGYASALTASALNVGTGGNVGIGALGDCNASGASYIAYLFADDTSSNGIIRCTTFTTDASGNANVDVGFEVQWATIKAASSAGDWIQLDEIRGWSLYGEDRATFANTNAVESVATDYGNRTAKGFYFKGAASTTYCVIAIRRPNKPPTTGTDVFAATLGLQQILNGGYKINGFEIPCDLIVSFGNRTTPSSPSWLWADRLRGYGQTGSSLLDSSSTAAHAIRTTDPRIYLYDGLNYINIFPDTNNVVHRFARKAKVFDIALHNGIGSTLAVDHNLGVIPELFITKRLDAVSSANGWPVFTGSVNQVCWLNLNNFRQTFNNTFPTAPTSSQFFVGSNADVGASGGTYVTYLFATLAGISKVGTYVGTAANQTINCGFSAGARLVWIKRMDAVGDWLVFDSARGINSAANEPYLRLNSSAAEANAEKLIPHASGFQVNDTAADINASGGTYLFLAMA